MKETTTHTETIQKDEVIAITCDCCGKVDDSPQIEYDSTIETFDFRFGYGSNHDGEFWQPDICTDCVMQWFGTFKHKPKVTNYI